jgi:acetyl esterase
MNSNRRATLGLGILLLAILAGPLGAAPDELNSRNSEHLRRWFAKYPDADANRDGIMTSDEAWKYQGGLAERIRIAKQKTAEAVKAGQPEPERLNPDLANVRYGAHERNVFDLWRAKSDRPTPLVIFYHGGGWRSGDKADIAEKTLRTFLEAGISVAAVNYRYTTTAPLPAPYLDSARALQLLRSKAAEWNLDPSRVAAYGPSAGAGISMWLGFHDDLADAASSDPIARESTRLVAVGSMAGQSTYDPNWVRARIGEAAYRHTLFIWAYGVKKQDQLNDPTLQKAYDEMSPITHVNAGDPPVFQYYTEPDTPLPADANVGQGIHHPIFGHRLKTAMDAVGIECISLHVADLAGDSQAEMTRFLCRKLTAH